MTGKASPLICVFVGPSSTSLHMYCLFPRDKYSRNDFNSEYLLIANCKFLQCSQLLHLQK